MVNDKNNEHPGFGLEIAGVIGIIVSILAGFGYNFLTSDFAAAGLLGHLINIVTFGLFFFGILLSIIIIGLGCILRCLKRTL